MTTTIAVTGGHLTPALAYIDYVLTTDTQVKFVFLGRAYSQPSTGQLAREKYEAELRAIPFYEIDAPTLQFYFSPKLITQWFAFLKAIWHSWQILRSTKPSATLSFGSYLAVPVVLASWLLGIPVITHEQTATAGSASRLIAVFAQKIALSFASSQQFFNASKTTVTGNPIRTAITHPTTKPPSWLATPLPKKPLILITGGNQGSAIINSTIQQLLPDLVKEYVIIHTCGASTATANYQTELLANKRQLPPRYHAHYYVKEWLTEVELGWVLAHCQGVVARAGANTVTELIATKTPAILVPLPFAKYNEQQLNAELITKKGGGILLLQSQLSPVTLKSKLTELVTHYATYQSAFSKIKIMTNGSEELHKLVVTTLNVKHHRN
jgi:UDP-N-acetylglucosamine--N-acetylmuramyl-(pentapeptide) pyrophosphoryl-undecaprenol N-acetylglucosamine transferase